MKNKEYLEDEMLPAEFLTQEEFDEFKEFGLEGYMIIDKRRVFIDDWYRWYSVVDENCHEFVCFNIYVKELVKVELTKKEIWLLKKAVFERQTNNKKMIELQTKIGMGVNKDKVLSQYAEEINELGAVYKKMCEYEWQ